MKRLEELGIGRPSTYASIMQTIQDRGYVWKKGHALVPTFTAFAVVNLLEQHFPSLVDYAFTATLEEELDEIAAGYRDMGRGSTEVLLRWQGSTRWRRRTGPEAPSSASCSTRSTPARSTRSRWATVPTASSRRPGRRYGPYLERGEDDAPASSIPEDIPPDELTVERAIELLEAPRATAARAPTPRRGYRSCVKAGRFGPYVHRKVVHDAERQQAADGEPFKAMSPDGHPRGRAAAAGPAARRRARPRRRRGDPGAQRPVRAVPQEGHRHPHARARGAAPHVTLDEALKIFAEPKQRGGRAPPGPLRELGNDPVTEKPIVVKDGRFGPYVTDGETNAACARATRRGDHHGAGASCWRTVVRAGRRQEEGRQEGGREEEAAKKAPAKKSRRRPLTGAAGTGRRAGRSGRPVVRLRGRRRPALRPGPPRGRRRLRGGRRREATRPLRVSSTSPLAPELLTAPIVAAGHDVVVVELVAGMLAQLPRSSRW